MKIKIPSLQASKEMRGSSSNTEIPLSCNPSISLLISLVVWVLNPKPYTLTCFMIILFIQIQYWSQHIPLTHIPAVRLSSTHFWAGALQCRFKQLDCVISTFLSFPLFYCLRQQNSNCTCNWHRAKSFEVNLCRLWSQTSKSSLCMPAVSAQELTVQPTNGDQMVPNTSVKLVTLCNGILKEW